MRIWITRHAVIAVCVMVSGVTASAQDGRAVTIRAQQMSPALAPDQAEHARGDVVLSLGSLVMRCQELQVWRSVAGRVERSLGHREVRVSWGERYLRADEVEIMHLEGVVILRGAVRVWIPGRATLRAKNATLHLMTGRLVLEEMTGRLTTLKAPRGEEVE